jgi:nucleoside-diphosphate kinase
MDQILRKGRERARLTEQTFVFLKPEAVMRGLIGEVVSRIERKGLTIAAMKLVQVTKEQAEKIYEVHRGKTFYEPLIERIISGPVLAMVIEGPNAVSVLRNMMGKTNPAEAQPGTIRGDYALNVQKNIIHAADSLENAKREIKILFESKEILQYKKPTEAQYLL